VILAGVMLKLGTYGCCASGCTCSPRPRLGRAAVPDAGVIGVLYGAVVATMQKDLKRLVAYSSIAHLGFIVSAFFAVTSQSLTGGC
jgi:NADH-quinone oxidoreductase subunit M